MLGWREVKCTPPGHETRDGRKRNGLLIVGMSWELVGERLTPVAFAEPKIGVLVVCCNSCVGWNHAHLSLKGALSRPSEG